MLKVTNVKYVRLTDKIRKAAQSNKNPNKDYPQIILYYTDEDTNENKIADIYYFIKIRSSRIRITKKYGNQVFSPLIGKSFHSIKDMGEALINNFYMSGFYNYGFFAMEKAPARAIITLIIDGEEKYFFFRDEQYIPGQKLNITESHANNVNKIFSSLSRRKKITN